MRKKIGLIVAFMVLLAMQGLAAGKFVLVIDAGHGGKDPGALGKTSKEKDLNLKVALAFGNYVEKNCPDVKVVYTRKTDVFVELKERANIANKNKADLFISIHTNALDGGKISRGFETYTLGMHRAADNLNVAKRENSVILIEKNYKQTYAGFDPNSAESYIMFEILQDKNMANSVELAKTIQSEVCSASGRVNKGVHQAGFLVLRETSMPSCLIEMGFITTPDEETYLNTNDGQDKIAKGIYNAFVKYKKKHGVKTAQNENDHQNNQLGPLDDMGMNELASNKTEPMQAHGDVDEEGYGNDEDLSSNGIVEQDDNLYAVTEYAQPRAVRDIGAISNATSIKPQDPVPLSITDETAQNIKDQQTPNAIEKQENLSTNNPSPVTPNIPASLPSTTDDNNVLTAHTVNIQPQTSDVSNKASSQKDISQQDTKPSSNQNPSFTSSITDIDQKPAEPVIVAQTSDASQKPVEPVVVAQTTDNSQKPAEPVVVAQTTDNSQKPAEPVVVAQTTDNSQKPAEPVVVAQTTDNSQKPAEPVVVAQTTDNSQKPAEPVVVAQTTNTGQKPAAVQEDNNTPILANQQQAKPGEGTQQASTPPAKFSGLQEVTAPPQGTILEGKPIFKVQIAATTEPQNVNSDFFHGFKNIDAYTENGMVKYTIGATDNFAEVESLRNTLLEKFPGAFIIAFRDGYKIPLQNALKEYRKQQ